MVLRKRILITLLAFSITWYAFFSQAANDPNHVQISSSLFGNPLIVSQNTDPLPNQLGAQIQTRVQFLGQPKTISNLSVEASPNGVQTPAATTQWYVGGVRIWTGNLILTKGVLAYTGGIAPTQIPFPAFVYPLGPVLLQIDAGIAFQGNLVAQLAPSLSLPLQDSSLIGTLQGQLTASGYVEGYAKLLVVRAGVGGKVSLINGAMGANTQIFMNQAPPVLKAFGTVTLLNGDVYGFVDTHLLLGQWKRTLSKDFFKWSGKCYAFGASSCAL